MSCPPSCHSRRPCGVILVVVVVIVVVVVVVSVAGVVVVVVVRVMCTTFLKTHVISQNMNRCFGVLKGRFRVLRYGLRWQDAESNHQTFVVCAMLHNAIIKHRETTPAEYELDNQAHFGSSVGDFEPYDEEERNLLRSERQVYRVVGRAGALEERPLLSFAEEEAQLCELRSASRRGSSSSSVADGGDGGGGSDNVGGGGDNDGSSGGSGGSDGSDGGSASRSGGGGGSIVGRPPPGTTGDIIAHYELRDKLAAHVWYLKSKKMLKWDSGSSPLSNVGFNIENEVADIIKQLLG